MNWKPTAPTNLTGERYVLAGLPADLGLLFSMMRTVKEPVFIPTHGVAETRVLMTINASSSISLCGITRISALIAAGNDGSDSDGDGKINAGSVTSPGTAKNCITVGACEQTACVQQLETYGSMGCGPTDFPVNPEKSDPMANNPDPGGRLQQPGPTKFDSRVKPDILAPGTWILLNTFRRKIAPNNFAWSVPTNKKYFYMGRYEHGDTTDCGAICSGARVPTWKKRGIPRIPRRH